MAILPWSSEPQGGTHEWIGGTNGQDRWLSLASRCSETRRLTAIVWCCIALFVLVDIVWLSVSSLHVAPTSARVPGGLFLIGSLIRLFGLLMRERVATSDCRFSAVLYRVMRKSELLWRGVFLLVLIVSAFLIFTYLATAAALPLQDDLLARIDRALGFDWMRFLTITNDNARIAAALTACYRSTGLLLIAIIVWLAVSEQTIRLAELLAALSVTFVALAVAMLALPTAGAFAHFAPPPALFRNFAGEKDMWLFYATFSGLRDGSLRVIELSNADGIVSFPSFHAALGVVTAWALRDSRWLLWPVLALNGTMMAATLPVGGHHLAEMIGGTLTGLVAIVLVSIRPGLLVQRRRERSGSPRAAY